VVTKCGGFLQLGAGFFFVQVFAELPSLKFVKCACLIGHNNNQDMRTRQMQETISKFRDGRVCYSLGLV
jgi:endoribonuclease Dicer